MNPNFSIREEEPEVWIEKKPAMGDYIRVNRGLYCHHGIYVSDDKFILQEKIEIMFWIGQKQRL